MNAVVIVFAGEYDLACKEQLRAELDRLVAVPNLVLDLSEVTYLDSTVVTELIRLHKLRTENHSGRETVVAHAGNIQKLLRIVGLDKAFRLVGALDEALDTDAQAEVRYAFSGTGPARTPLEFQSESAPNRPFEGTA